MRICFVCLGNICRSPTARGCDAEARRRRGPRAIASRSTAPAPATGTSASCRIRARARPRAARGYRSDASRAPVHAADFDRFDLVLAMDRSNLRDLAARSRERRAHVPRDAAAAQLRSDARRDAEVPDPYARRRRRLRGGARSSASARARGCSTYVRERCVEIALDGRGSGTSVVARRPVGGGDINDAYRVELADRRARVREDARATRRRGCSRPRPPASRGCARVRCACRACSRVGDAFLALEWLELGGARPDPRALGRGLAQLHALGAPSFGLDRDNFLATLPQDNTREPDWPTFYVERRLRPLCARAQARRSIASSIALRAADRLRSGRAAGAPARRSVVGQRRGRAAASRC